MIFRLLVFAAASGAAFAQLAGNQSLNGTYYFRQVLLVTDGASTVIETRSGAGTLTFNGNGNFTFLGEQIVGTTPSAALSGSGTYTVKPGGFVTLTNPLRTNATINARLGTGVLIGASTEAGPTVFDLFIALPQASQLSNQTLSGPYHISTLEFPGGGTANARNTNFTATANGSGGFAQTAVTGQARNLGDRLITQNPNPITYSVAPAGTGTINFPAGDNSQLVAGLKNIYVSQDGSFFIGGSTAAGGHGIITGVKAFTGGATNASWNGFFFTAGLRFDAGRSRLSAVTGAVNVTANGAVFARRTRQSDGLLDAATLATYSLEAGGSGPFQSTPGHVNVASTGTSFTTSGVDVIDSLTYELSFGSRMPSQSGSGVFLNPLGVLNAASFAPPGYPVSPGGFVTLFGSGLSAQTTAANSFPFPTTLANVRVTFNGIPAPVYAVSATQISAIVPYSVTGTTANVIVINNVTSSNTVEVPLSPTAPGVFSLTQNGLGDGAVLDAAYRVVNAQNPAPSGSIVQVYLTGLGAVQPPVADGAAAPVNPLARVVSPLAVTVGGSPAVVHFSGLAPTLAGLYQLNIEVPRSLAPGVHSLAIQTVEGFTDLVDLRVGN